MLKLLINNTKTMSQKKKKQQQSTLFHRLIKAPALVVVAALFGVCIVATPIVAAQSIQQQINDLSNQNSQTQSTVNSLQLQASSYQDAVSKLQTQISAIQGAIAASQSQEASLQQQILQAQADLNQQKQILGSDIKAMYVGGQMTTVEELATSKNLSDFVNAETYRNAVQSEVQNTLVKISQLQNQLQDQKSQVEQLLQTQQLQNSQLSSDEQQQQGLLSYNQTQQSQYDQQIQANKSQISGLEAEQAAINERNTSSITLPASGGTGGRCATPSPWYTGSNSTSPNGSYPTTWCNANQDSLTTSGGFPNRECTSFAFWYFTTQESGHSGFFVTGNANQWNLTANRPVDQTPADGAIAVDTSGPYGHVMIVIATPGEVYGGSTVPAGEIDTISMNDDYAGHFFALQRSLSGFYFIH
jgi:peptidoglycan hydrolase CwlO-like protein